MENAMEQIIATVQEFGGNLASENRSALSSSAYLKFDGIPTTMSKATKRDFFARFPKAHGATFDGRFSVRVTDHNAVSCRETTMFEIRTNRPIDPQIECLRKMLDFLANNAKPIETF